MIKKYMYNIFFWHVDFQISELWKKIHFFLQKFWTNEPVLEICPKTKLARLPSYMRGRLSSASSQASTKSFHSLTSQSKWDGGGVFRILAHTRCFDVSPSPMLWNHSFAITLNFQHFDEYFAYCHTTIRRRVLSSSWCCICVNSSHKTIFCNSSIWKKVFLYRIPIIGHIILQDYFQSWCHLGFILDRKGYR